MSEPRARVFVGLALGAELGAAVARPVAAVLNPAEYRLARSEGLHLTLRYIGMLGRERVPELGRFLRNAMEGLAAPDLLLGGTGAFPEWSAPRVLWLEVSEPTGLGRLEACQRAVGSALRRAGIEARPEERVFRPHVTVARPREPGLVVPEGFAALRCDFPWTPAAVCCFESRGAPGGAHYAILQRTPF